MLGRLHQVLLPVEDLDVAREFYEKVLGLPFIAAFDPPGLLFFDLGGPRLLLERLHDDDLADEHSMGTLYLMSDDIDADIDRLRSQGVEIDDPHLIHHDVEGTFGSAGEVEGMAFFLVPDGHSLALVSRHSPRGPRRTLSSGAARSTRPGPRSTPTTYPSARW